MCLMMMVDAQHKSTVLSFFFIKSEDSAFIFRFFPIIYTLQSRCRCLLNSFQWWYIRIVHSYSSWLVGIIEESHTSEYIAMQNAASFDNERKKKSDNSGTTIDCCLK